MKAWGALAVLALAGNVAADDVVHSRLHDFRVVTVAQGLENPWAVAFLPDGRMLVTERPGRLRIVASGRLLPEPVQGVPAVAAERQGGLLDVALHPRFADNRLVYLSYAARSAGGLGIEAARARLEGSRLEDLQVIFRQEPALPGGQHLGSRLVFDGDGLLHVTLGDRGQPDRAQHPEGLVGVTLRLRDDGTPPADNPFADRPEVYTYGHRNVQGAAWDPVTGRLWANEHGPKGGDELNLLRAGGNYGWPVVSHGVGHPGGTHREGMVPPVHAWVPGIGPCGLAVYRGGRFPRWQGDLFVGGLDAWAVTRLRLDREQVVEEERLLQGIGRVRDVRAAPDGLIYFLTDSADGALYRLEPLP